MLLIIVSDLELQFSADRLNPCSLEKYLAAYLFPGQSFLPWRRKWQLLSILAGKIPWIRGLAGYVVHRVSKRVRNTDFLHPYMQVSKHNRNLFKSLK